MMTVSGQTPTAEFEGISPELWKILLKQLFKPFGFGRK